MQKTLYSISLSKKKVKQSLIQNILKVQQNVWTASSSAKPLKAARCGVTVILSRGFIPKEQRKGRKREDTVWLFSEWRVLEVRKRSFHTETMAPATPRCALSVAPLPSPYPVSVSASEQKHAAHPARHDTPAKSSLPAPQLVSFTPKLFPGRTLTAPHSLWCSQGHTNRQANTSLSSDTGPFASACL